MIQRLRKQKKFRYSEVIKIIIILNSCCFVMAKLLTNVFSISLLSRNFVSVRYDFALFWFMNIAFERRLNEIGTNVKYRRP